MTRRARDIPLSNSDAGVAEVTQRVSASPKANIRRPGWHWEVVALWAQGVTYAEMAARMGKSRASIEGVMKLPWVREEKRRIAAAREVEGRRLLVNPVEKFQEAGTRMADIMLAAAEDAEKPMERALIAEKNLALGGWTPVQRSVHLDLTARLRDRRAVTDEELLAFVNGGEVPAALQGPAETEE